MDRPLRTLHLFDGLGYGGAEGQLVELLERLPAHGITPRVACLRRRGPYLAELDRRGLWPEEFPLRGTLLRPNSAVQIVRLAAFILRERIALVHSTDVYTNLLAVPAARLAAVPLVASRLDLAHWYGGLRRAAVARACRAARRVVVNAEAIRELLVREERLDPAQIVVVRNGIDLCAFDVRAAAAPTPEVTELAPGGAPAIMVVANLAHPVKGHVDLLHAFRVVLAARPAVRLLLVGDGALRPGLERLAAALGLAHAVRFLGHRADVPALLARATVAVSASHAEGLSNALIEAMAARRAVVATAVGGTPELVEEGRTGLLAPARAPGALAGRILALLDDPAWARRLGEQARAHVASALPITRLVGQTAALYRELLSEPPSRACAPRPAVDSIDARTGP